MTMSSVAYTTSSYTTAITDYVAAPSAATEAEVQESITTHLRSSQDDALSALSDSSKFSAQLTAWKGGGSGDTATVGQLAAQAADYDPAALQTAVADGTLTQAQANALIMIGGLANTGLTANDIDQAMRNFCQLPADAQQKMVDEMAGRSVTPSFDWQVTPNGDGTNEVTVTNLAYLSAPPTKAQQEIARLLSSSGDLGPLLDKDGLAALDGAVNGWKDHGWDTPDAAVAYAKTLAGGFSQPELDAAVDAGLISRDDANAALVLAGLSQQNVGSSATGMAMEAYFRLSPEDQQTVVQAMATAGPAQDSMTGFLTDQSATWHRASDLHESRYLSNMAVNRSTWSQGKSVVGSQIDTMLAKAGQFSPTEIRQGLSGDLSSEGDMLIVLTGLSDAGLSSDEIDTAMQNFYKLPPEDQQYVLGQMSERSTTPTAFGAASGPSDFSKAKLTYASSPPTPEQVKIGLFLVNTPADQLAGIRDFVTVETESAEVPASDTTTSRDHIDACLAANVDDWDALAPADQKALTDTFMNLTNPNVAVDASGNYVAPVTNADGNPAPSGDGKVETVVVGKPMTPEDLRGKGLTDDQTVDIGTLMFLVLMDRMESQDELIRGYTADVDAKNQDLKNATAAQAALRACDADDGTVDTSEVYFTDQSGNEVSIYDYCEAYGIEMPEDGNGNPKQQLDKTDLDNLLTSMKSYSDTLSTDAQSALQKLQQATDRYSNTNSLLTNFESSWRSMLKEVIGNLRM